MTGRRTGVGLEVTPTVVRGVVVDDRAGRVAATNEVPLPALDDDEAVFEALTALHQRIDASDRPTRIAWFPTGALLQRLDVTGRSMSDLNALRRDLDDQHGFGSSMLLDVGPRRWMLALRWNQVGVRRIEMIAERAGFIDAAVEPAPISLHRVVGPNVSVARRDGSATSCWAATFDGDLPVLATSIPTGRREYPSLATDESVSDVRFVLADAATIVAQVGSAVQRGLPDDRSAPGPEPKLQVLGEPYPPFPAHDLRAPQRIAVALGAALGAAGHTGASRPVEAVTPSRPIIDEPRRPWTLERVVELPETTGATSSWWRRILRWIGVGGRQSRSNDGV